MILGSWKSQKVAVYDDQYHYVFQKSNENMLGNFISINYDGDVVAYTDSSNTYIVMKIDNTWTLMGDLTISGDFRGVSLSKDGLTVVTTRYKSRTRVHTFSKNGDTWSKNQKGSNISHSNVSTNASYHNENAISFDGNVVIVTEKWFNNKRGRFLIYYYQNDQWQLFERKENGQSVNDEGQSNNEQLGNYFVSASSTLSHICVSSFFGGKGKLYLYEMTNLYN